MHTPLASAHCAVVPLTVQAPPTLPVVQAPASVQAAAVVHEFPLVAPAFVHVPLSVQAAALAHTVPKVAPALVQVFGLAWQFAVAAHGPLATPPVFL